MQESLLTNDDLTQEQAGWDRQRLQAALLADKADLLLAIRPRLLRLARLRGVDADACEDVVQETLLEPILRKAGWQQKEYCMSPRLAR